MNDSFQPTSISQSLYTTNRQLLGAKLKRVQGELQEIVALLNIKKLEGNVDYQKGDRAYVVMRLGDRVITTQQRIDQSKSQIRALKKELRNLK